ncbi:MAG: tetratricopeptide repeat protein, partial [Gemmatimonadales bacterium]
SRVRDLAPLAALLLVTLAISLGLRGVVLIGLDEGVPEIALLGLGFGGRALTMLGVVPEWTRLLLWPAHLRADYSPPGFDAANHLGLPQVSGLLLLAGGVAAMVALRRSAPVAGFGLAWCALALAPVSNLVFPTGVLLAERTLFLPSAGLCLALGALVGTLAPRLARRALPRAAVILGVGTILSAGLVSSARRQRIWRDTETLFARTLLDAPTSYRAFWTYGTVIYGKGRGPEAEAALRHAVELYPHDPQVYEELGQMLRRRGDCVDALPLLARALEIDAGRVVARSRLFYCRLGVGDVEGARATAAEAVARGQPEFGPLLAKADSLLRARKLPRP